jgi:two-component system sensor histidine kinase KdpD
VQDKIIREHLYMQSSFSKTLRSMMFGVLRSLTCLLLIAAITWVAFAKLHVNALIAGFVYFLAVLIVATRWGLLEALVTSIAAMLCLNYFFLPPILSVTITDPQNWVALFAFMVTAVTASQLSARAHKQASEAQARRAEVERLYQLGLSLMLVDTTQELGPQIASSVKEQFGFSAVTFCDGATDEIHVVGVESQEIDPDVLHSIATGEASWSVTRKQITQAGHEAIVVPVALGGRTLGSIGAVGPTVSEPALQAIANLAAVALEHARQQISFGRLEVARQNERLRGVLLDALAHDFLTPLTTVKTAISTARSEYRHDVEEEEFLTVAEEETDKLSEMVNEITDLARIEPGKLRIRQRPVQVEDLIHASLKRTKALEDGRLVDVQTPPGLPRVNVDPEMFRLALRQLVGNAIKFSPPETPIEITARAAEDAVMIQIRDHGPGIPPDERALIFDRFFRGKHVQNSVAGTGMGLSIARDIVSAHHGRIWVENNPQGGAIFSLTLPVVGKDTTS